MKKATASIVKLALIIAISLFTFSTNSQSIGGVDGSCTISVHCGGWPGNKVECKSDVNDCKRNKKKLSVTCDGVTTTC